MTRVVKKSDQDIHRSIDSFYETNVQGIKNPFSIVSPELGKINFLMGRKSPLTKVRAKQIRIAVILNGLSGFHAKPAGTFGRGPLQEVKRIVMLQSR